jgi:plasmid stability protein
MRNITVTVDDELYRQARVRAAEEGSTVSAMVRAFLQRWVQGDARFQRLQRQQDALIERIRRDHPGFAASDRLSRGDVHERDALR